MNCPKCGRESEFVGDWQSPKDQPQVQVRIGMHYQHADCLGDRKAMVAWSELRHSEPQSVNGWDTVLYKLDEVMSG